MKNTDVSFKQRRRARKQVDSDDSNDENDCVIGPPASSNPVVPVDVQCKPLSPPPAKPTRKPDVLWRSAAAKKEVDALIKYYEEVRNTRNVFSPEASATSRTIISPATAADVCVHESESPAVGEAWCPVPCTQPEYPKGFPRTSHLVHQEERHESSVTAGSCSLSPESARPPLSPNATRPGCEPEASSPPASIVSLGTEMGNQAGHFVALSKVAVSNSGLNFDVSSSQHDDEVDHEAEDQIESFKNAESSRPFEALHTSPRSVCLAQGQPCSHQSPLGQVPPHVSSSTVSVDRAMLGEAWSGSSGGSKADLESPRSGSSGETKSRVEPGVCALGGSRSSGISAQLGTAAGCSSEAESCQHGRVSAYTAEVLDHPVVQAVGQCGSRLEPAPGLPAPRAGSTCTTPCLPGPDVQASPSDALAHRSVVTPRSLQQSVVEAEQASSCGHCSGRNSDASPDSSPQLAPDDVQAAPTADDIFFTPQLSLASGQGCARDPARATSPTQCTSGAPIQTGTVGEARSQSVQPRTSLWCPRSHMAGEYRRAKARASVSYGSHSALPLSKTPYRAKTPGTAWGVPRPRASVLGSAMPWHSSQLALPDALSSPGLSKVEVIPEGSDDEEGSPCCRGSIEILSPIQQALQACGQDAVGDFTECMQQRYADAKILKIGEGSFKEVYLCGDNVVSVIPIEGDVAINDEEQLSIPRVLPELIAHIELSKLRRPTAPCRAPAGPKSQCSTFVDVAECMLVRGEYYLPFAKAWKHFKKTGRDAENEDPSELLPKDQLFLILVCENGGKPLDTVPIYSLEEAKSIILQVTLALAVAETCHEFEHRDLHWGNILIQKVEEQNEVQCFVLDDVEYMVHTYGNKVCIIDYTLCRLTPPEGPVFVSLIDDLLWLFTETTGKQGDAYRRMKTAAEKVWKKHDCPDLRWEIFTPSTNAVWIAYLCDELPGSVVIEDKAGGLALKRKKKQSWDPFRHAI